MGLTVYGNGTDQPIGGDNIDIHQEARHGVPSLASCLSSAFARVVLNRRSFVPSWSAHRHLLSVILFDPGQRRLDQSQSEKAVLHALQTKSRLSERHPHECCVLCAMAL